MSETRREFLKTAAAATAASQNRILGANDRIRVGNVGCGRRGLLRELIQIRDDAQVEVAAVCDTWRQKREKAERPAPEEGVDPDIAGIVPGPQPPLEW